jgi:hypothetical protein
LELLVLTGVLENNANIGPWLLPVSCWSGWLLTRRRGAELADFDREWLIFRDRFGLMWGQRVREQFNRAAVHAGWAVILRWSGLRKTEREIVVTAEEQAAILGTLRGLVKRFGHTADQ